MEEFDNKIKRSVNQYGSSVPNDMWDRIERELPIPKKENKIIPLYWSIGIVLMLLSLASLYYLNTTAQDQPISIPITNSNNIVSTDDHTSIDHTGHIHKTEEDLQTKKIAANIIDKEEQNQINKISKPNKISNQLESGHNISNSSLIESKNVNQVILNRNSDKLDVNSELLNLTDNNTIITSNEDQKTSNTNVITTEVSSKVEHNTIMSVSRIIETYELLPSTNTSLLQVGDQIQDIGNLNYDIDVVREPTCPDVRAEGNEHFLFEAHFNPIYNHYTFKSKSSEFDGYPKMRENSESNRLSYNLGFRTGFKNAKGYMFSTGLDFTQLNTKFNHIDSAATRKTTIIDTIFNNDGTVKEVKSKTITVYGTNEIKSYNYMTMLDIPLLFSYEFPISRRSNFNITAGVFLNLSFAHEARIINPEDVPVWVSSSSTKDYSVYKDGLGISFYLSAGYNYQLSDKWHLLVMPNVRIYSENFTIGSYPLSEKHHLFGLRTGVRYLF